MGDMGDMYRDWDKIKKERKEKREIKNDDALAEWLEENSKATQHVMRSSSSVLFRFPGKPKTDFYPTTNKWVCKNKTYYGDVMKCLNWVLK